MTTESEQKGFIIFNDARDIQMMEELSDAYHRVFSAQEVIAADHRKIPDLLAIKRGEKKHWMPLCDAKTVGYLPRQLTVSQLKPAHFDDAAESYAVSINQNLTHSSIGLGLNYIDHVEQSAWNRQTWKAFEYLHRPAYYLITLISERIKSLCRFKPSQSLVQEYHCLAVFLDHAVGIASHYFSSHEEVEPFHCYLSDVADGVTAMKLRLEFYLERTAMAEHLDNMANLLDAYRAGLAIYLTYAISDAPLNEAVHLGQLLPFKKKIRSEKAQTLPADFRESRIYRNLNRALSGKLEGIVNKIRVENAGVSYLLKKSAKANEKTRRGIEDALTAYHELLLSLNVLPALIRGLRALSDGAKLQGEYEIVHDEALHATLEVQLRLTTQFLTQSRQRIDQISAQNKHALYGNENFQRGATLNIRCAQRQSERLNQIGRPILENRQAISERIQKIQQLNPDTLKAQRNALLKKTSQLLTQFQKYAILPVNELTGLQGQLAKVYPQENTENPRGFSRPIAVSMSTAEKGIALGNNEEQASVTMRQTPTQDGNPPTNGNNRYPFPEIYAAFANQANTDQLCQQFNELMKVLDNEIEVNLSRLLNRLEEIYRVIALIDEQLKILDATDTQLLSEAKLETLFCAFSQLSGLRQIKYLSLEFINFSCINQIITEFHCKIRDVVLEQIIKIFPEALHHTTSASRMLQSNKLRLSIIGYFMFKLKPIKLRIDELKKKSESMPHWSEGNLIDYYRDAIQLCLQRLPEHERPCFEKPQPPTTTELNTVVTASMPASHSSDRQEQPQIIPATREEVFKAFESLQKEVKKPAALPKKAKRLTVLDKLNGKCNALFREDITTENLKNGIEGLIDFLIGLDYTLNGGGERIKHPVTGKYKKVPFAIKRLAQLYADNLDNVLLSKDSKAMKELRDLLFKSIDFAAKNPNYRFYFYNPRDRKTQAIYETLVSCYEAQKENTLSVTP